MKPLKILIAEDEEPFQLVFKRLLKPLLDAFEGSQVTVTKTMSEAMQIIASHPRPEIVILDLNLLDSNIEATIKRLKEIEDFAPLVIVTGYQVEFVTKLIGEGHQYEIITKDEGLGGLIGAITRAISRWHERRFAQITLNLQRMKALA